MGDCVVSCTVVRYVPFLLRRHGQHEAEVGRCRHGKWPPARVAVSLVAVSLPLLPPPIDGAQEHSLNAAEPVATYNTSPGQSGRSKSQQKTYIIRRCIPCVVTEHADGWLILQRRAEATCELNGVCGRRRITKQNGHHAVRPFANAYIHLRSARHLLLLAEVGASLAPKSFPCTPSSNRAGGIQIVG